MKSIFENESYQEILDRLEKLTPESVAQWGKMNVSQMIVHCQKPLELALGKIQLKKPNFLMGFMLKQMSSSLYNDKPWKQGLPTAKEFVIVDVKDFLSEKEKLVSLIKQMHERKDSSETFPVHPYFGKFTHEQWGKASYKHLDHHLTQFGV
ncbi:Protein of unknown function [Pustulibacterium marinum]|uniref:DUF1569 domain-containing protein n=1 Tax=Pustulibacterium marinum TaxID=1224947 RepID=A0A1I7F5R4_9FLAO|nr:DUF1569 domain-containing protein [Pustulibacterium marinum]SFU31532.1 Protein of unknown function [Pustulibacterium marinum]